MVVLPADLEDRGSSNFTPVHVLNIDIKDNHEEATLGAFLVLELCEMVSCAYQCVSVRVHVHVVV